MTYKSASSRLHSGIYLDNATATQPSERAIHEMMPFLTDKWGSLSAPHQKGQESVAAVEKSCRAIYELLGGKDADTLVFTSSGAEAVNHAIFSTYLDVTLKSGRNHFLTTAIEEAPSLMAVGRMEKWGGVAKTVKPNTHGLITAESVAATLSPRSALLSMSWANGLTGIIHPVIEIAKLCKERGVRFHLDATAILGKLFFDLDEIGADILTFEGSRLHAPAGTGGIFTREGLQLSPFIAGGAEQGGWRAGPLNVAGAVALGIAAEETLQARDLMCTEVARLRDKLEKSIQERYQEVEILFKDYERLPHITVLAFPGIANEALLFALNQHKVFASMGGGNFQQLSLLLSASGVPSGLNQTALSFSLSRYTTEDEIESAVEIIAETAQKLRVTSRHILSR